MLVIRLLRTGKKNQPFYKIVVTEKRNPPRGGRFVEQIGFYNPKTKEKSLDKERTKYWISKGAQPSATMHNMMVREGVLDSAKIPMHKKSKKKEEKAEEKPKAAEAPQEQKPEEAPKQEEVKQEEPVKEEKKTEEPKEEKTEQKLEEAPKEEKKEEPKKE